MYDQTELYRMGYETGISGVPQKMPEDIWTHENTDYRDWWRDGDAQAHCGTHFTVEQV